MCKTVEPVTTAAKRKGQDGYILIDIAISMASLGIIMVAFLQFQKYFKERENFIETSHKVEIIADALSTFAQTRWRLPCPADPLKANNVPFGTERVACSAALGLPDRTQHGIVPYRTLGLPEQYAKDNYGNFFTYIVSPAFTRLNRVTNTGADRLHARLAHYMQPGNIGFLPKAQFCGALDQDAGGNAVTAADDLSIQQGGTPLTPGARDQTFLAVPANPPDPNYYRDLNVSAFAVAIISHGPNGYGAYLANNSSSVAQNIAPPGAGASEDATRTIDNLIALEREIRRNSGATYYDDIITIFTQDQILSAAGGGSCEHP